MSKKIVWLHICGSLLFLLMPVLLSPDFSLDFHFIHIRPFQKSFLAYFILLAIFYLNHYLLLPKLDRKGTRIWYYVLLAILFLLICVLLHEFMRHGHRPPKLRHSHGTGMRMIRRDSLGLEMLQVMPLFLFVVALSHLLRAFANLKQAQKEKMTSELNFLKSQINPHFLFNSLNSIYALAIQKSDQAPGAILSLSAMMRYMLYETKENMVPLESELQYIDNYIKLNRLRLNENTLLEFELQGEPAGQKIAPLILIPFIENVFKHGINTEKKVKLIIRIRYDRRTLSLYTENEILPNHSGQNEGVGLNVTLKRLELLYPQNFELLQKTENNIYYLQLKIDLDDKSHSH